MAKLTSRAKTVISEQTRFVYEYSIVVEDRFTIERGELIKIKGANSYGVREWGARFKFFRLVTDTESGNQWIDCFEMFRGQTGPLRSFTVDRVKRIPKKRGRRAKRD